MLSKTLKWIGIFFCTALASGVFYWWLNLPYHDLPIEHRSSEIAPGVQNSAMLHPTFRDVAYGSQSRFQKLDIYLPQTGSGPFPLVVWIHGGGLIMGDKTAMPQTDFGPAPTPTGPYGPYQVQVPDVGKLNASGYAVVSLNYRLGATPVTAARSAIRDCKTAIRFLRENAKHYNIDPNRFAAWGNSMGGYLAAMLGVTGDRATVFDEADALDISSAVQAVVVWYGAEDRMPGRSLDLGYQISQSKRLPPFLIANGDNDPVITVEQASWLHELLVQAGADSRLHIVPGAGHEDPRFRTTQMVPTFDFLDEFFKVR